MISRWPICFERGARTRACRIGTRAAARTMRREESRRGTQECVRYSCALLLLVHAAAAATVTGRVELADSRDASVRKNRNYSGVVVWLEPAGRPAIPPPAGQHFKMLQKEKRFAPHVLAIPVGATVDFPNLDPIFHNAFSNFSGQPFDVGLYAPGTNRAVTFRHPGFVRVFCNIHSAMSAIIAVVPTQ